MTEDPKPRNPRKSRAKLSAVVACYRDAPAVPIMHRRLVAVFEELGSEYEIVFVNDGSPDNARQVLAELAAQDPRVTVVNHTRAFGSQSAFTSGMRIATGDAVVLMDGDLQDPPELISEFVEKWREGYDVVYGERVQREAPFAMRFAYKLFYRSFRRASYLDVPLDAGDFGLLDRRVVDALNQLPEKHRFIRGLRTWVGFRQTGVPYVRPERMFGQSTNSVVKNLGWARQAILSFSYAPINFIAWLALATVGLSFVAMIVSLGMRIAYPSAAPKGFTTLLVVILFMGGIQLLCLSIIGSYLAHIYEEVKGRPPYLVDEILNPPSVGVTSEVVENAGAGTSISDRVDTVRPPPVVTSPRRRERRDAVAVAQPSARRALVTGGAGFVGTNVVRRLLDDGHRLTVIVRPGSELWRLRDVVRQLEVVEVDLRDEEAVRAVVRSTRPEWTFHLAAHGAYSWQQDTHDILTTNLLATVALVETCRSEGCEAFIHAGSSSEYGFKDHATMESEPVEPNSEYAVAKASATSFCRYVAQRHDFNAVTLRLYSVYGAYEDPRRLIPTLISLGMRNQLPPLVSPDVARDFVAVEDVVDAFMLAVTDPGLERGGIYNVGTGVQTTVRDAVEVARRVLSVDVEPTWSSAPLRDWDATTWVADNSKISAELGWKPRYSFQEGFERTADWLRTTPSVWSKYDLARDDEAVLTSDGDHDQVAGTGIGDQRGDLR
jgi:dolichol-phosphate mannosyltransferase